MSVLKADDKDATKSHKHTTTCVQIIMMLCYENNKMWVKEAEELFKTESLQKLTFDQGERHFLSLHHVLNRFLN